MRSNRKTVNSLPWVALVFSIIFPVAFFSMSVALAGGGGKISTFLGLTDTPDSYDGEAGSCVQVADPTEDGIVFFTCPEGGDAWSTIIMSNGVDTVEADGSNDTLEFRTSNLHGNMSISKHISQDDVMIFSHTEHPGTDISTDLEEENHVAEHAEGGSELLPAENLATSCANRNLVASNGSGGMDCTGAETGDWTPEITFENPGDVSVSYTLQQGHYTRIANQVTLVYQVLASVTHSTASGNLRVIGAPFNFDTQLGLQPRQVGAVIWQGIDAGPDHTQISHGISTAGAPDTVFEYLASGMGVGGVAIDETHVASGNTVFLNGSITYFAEE